MTRLGWIVTTLLVASGVLTGCSNEPWMTQEPIAPRVAVLRAPRWERPELAATPTVAATVPPHLAGWDVASADREWRYIVIHHSATEYGNAQTFDKAHRDRGWDELGYHFVIDNGNGGRDGRAEVGSRWTKQKHGAHTGGTPDNEYNEAGIGICMVGDFTDGMPSLQQQRTLESLVTYLTWKYDIPASRVITHRDAPGATTECPGGEFHAYVHDGFQTRYQFYLSQYPVRPDGWVASR